MIKINRLRASREINEENENKIKKDKKK